MSQAPDQDTDVNRTSTAVLSPEEVAAKVGVAPMNSSASPRLRKRAYFWFRRLLAISQLLDPMQIPNSFVNYQCVWWKAISGNDKTSPLQDDGLAYDLLPPLTRWAVAPPVAHLYPRFHHGNVELRTKYLDTAMEQIVEHVKAQVDYKNNNNISVKIRLVLLGGGYDLRSLRMAQRYQNQGCALDLVEVDLPNVIQAKQKLLQQRLLRRRPHLAGTVNSVRLFEVDLNDLEQFKIVIHKILENNENENDGMTATTNVGKDNYFTVFVFEAVLIYLDDGIPSRILAILSEALKRSHLGGALCFADTLSNVDDGNEEEAKQELMQNGWTLNDWIPKPGRTRHLGWATVSN